MKNTPICGNVDCAPERCDERAERDRPEREANRHTTRASRDQRKSACGGVGVSSSMIAARARRLARRMRAADGERCGATRPPSIADAAPRRATIAGNGTSNAKIATKPTAAMTHSTGCFSAREPIRHAACSTIATTAGLMP